MSGQAPRTLSRGKLIVLFLVFQSSEEQSSPGPIPKRLQRDFYQTIGFLTELAKFKREHKALQTESRHNTVQLSEHVCPASSWGNREAGCPLSGLVVLKPKKT